MAKFDGVTMALRQGAKVRRVKTWDAETVMFIQGDALVVSAYKGEPSAYDLSWYEIEAGDWEVIEPVKAA
ncbi:hypothetical protein [Acidicapsa acidisoli]|uniref:hypothetical protein n=1 Tax=Acidicapsa acidisoli TaxID=1615681 RepID=UPI0021DFEECB|nr:hypothetical protein [Acidicapsa acidisoli]